MDVLNDFVSPPHGMLSEQIDLPDFRLTLGLIHPEGGDVMICAWDGERWRNLAPKAAIRYAQQLEAENNAALFRPVTDALRALADKADEIKTSAMMRRAANRVGAPRTVADLLGMASMGRA